MTDADDLKYTETRPVPPMVSDASSCSPSTPAAAAPTSSLPPSPHPRSPRATLLFEKRSRKRRSIRRSDRPHTTGIQQHNHILFKGNEVAVINKDGTPSHNTSRDGIPRHVIDHMVKKKFIKEGHRRTSRWCRPKSSNKPKSSIRNIGRRPCSARSNVS
jgi:hypothetical protein